MKFQTEKNVKLVIKMGVKTKICFSVSSQEFLIVIAIEIFKGKRIPFEKTRGWRKISFEI